MPVRIVTDGGDPVRVVTHGGDPVRIVTRGISDPVRIIGACGIAPTYLSGEVGNVDASTVVVIFSSDITASCGDYALGFTIYIDGVADAITAAVLSASNAISFTITTAVVNGDVVTISYDSAVGCITESCGVTDLGTFTGESVTNNVASAGNGLLNNLIAYWPGNEVSGNALDLHTNALTLTDVNTVTSAVGKVYALARQYASSTAEYHNRLGDDALLSTGDVDFTLATWVYTDTQVIDMWCVSKWEAIAGARGYGIRYVAATDRIGFIVRDAADTTNVEAVANTYGAVPNATWIFVVGWHDSVADTVNIQINNGVVDSVALVGGCANDTSRFTVGAPSNTIGVYWNGRIGPTMFWKSAGGAGGVLTAAQRTALYNAGAGLPYASFTV